jgi:hypothetical protein
MELLVKQLEEIFQDTSSSSTDEQVRSHHSRVERDPVSHPEILISECEPFPPKKLKISKKNSFILN